MARGSYSSYRNTISSDIFAMQPSFLQGCILNWYEVSSNNLVVRSVLCIILPSSCHLLKIETIECKLTIFHCLLAVQEHGIGIVVRLCTILRLWGFFWCTDVFWICQLYFLFSVVITHFEFDGLSIFSTEILRRKSFWHRGDDPARTTTDRTWISTSYIIRYGTVLYLAYRLHIH